ncbi:MAG: transcriptional regulator [Verrucomicrobia bacterium]|nr:MAG: transcriptional regulator [Verrucomicrobiota bacterium]
MNEKKNPGRTHRPPVGRMLESVLGCKWSLTVLGLVRKGIRRPGAMERSVPGLTTKVLNERLRKLTRYGILERRAFPEVPPRVEYHLTPFGRKFDRLLRMVERLQAELDQPDQPPDGKPS